MVRNGMVCRRSSCGRLTNSGASSDREEHGGGRLFEQKGRERDGGDVGGHGGGVRIAC